MKAKSRALARAAACVLAGLAVLAPCPADGQQTVSLDEAVERALVRSPQMLQQDQAVDNAALGERSAWAAFLPNLSMNTSGSLRSANVLDPNTGQIVTGSSDSYSAGLSPTVVASAYVTGAAAASVRSAKTGYLPSVSLSSGYNWNNQERSFNGGRTSWSVGMSLSYPIFNNFQRESSIGRAQFSQRVAQLQEDDSRLAARQEADGALYNLRTAVRAIEIAQEAELVAGEDLRVVRERYSVGYVLARAELESILGRVL